MSLASRRTLSGFDAHCPQGLGGVGGLKGGGGGGEYGRLPGEHAGKRFTGVIHSVRWRGSTER